MARAMSNKAKKTLEQNGVSAYKVAVKMRRKRKGFSENGRTKNHGFTTKG